MHYLPLLTIAGSDCSGGAGIQADLKTFSALGAYGMSAITAVTVQNTCGVSAVHPVPAEVVEAQVRAVLTDIPPAAIKIGMLTDEAVIRAVACCLADVPDTPVVLDPVMLSSSGYPLLQTEALTALIDCLIPRATVLTPNQPEAELLAATLGQKKSQKPTRFTRNLLKMGCRSVLVKGGHSGRITSIDTLAVADSSAEGSTLYTYRARRIDARNTHGTGCTLSSAIAVHLAQGSSIPEAVAKAKIYLTRALRAGKDVKVGQGCGPLNHFFAPKKPVIR